MLKTACLPMVEEAFVLHKTWRLTSPKSINIHYILNIISFCEEKISFYYIFQGEKQGLVAGNVELCCRIKALTGFRGREVRRAMAIPVGLTDVERALRPWLGTLFLSANDLAACVAERMRAYAPYRQTLESLRDELETLLLTRLNRLTGGSMTVITDNYHTRRLGMAKIAAITDDLMGVIFDKLTPFSANFIKLNDYSLRVYSLNALRVLYQRYAGFYTPEELAFMARMIRTIYPPESYAAWLGA